MANEDLLLSLGSLLAYVQTNADAEAASGPTWLADISSSGLSQLREFNTSAKSGHLVLARDFDITLLLGQAWVDVHVKVQPLIQDVNNQLRRK